MLGFDILHFLRPFCWTLKRDYGDELKEQLHTVFNVADMFIPVDEISTTLWDSLLECDD